MTLGPKVGEGRQAEVFEWADSSDGRPQVVKLFREGRSRWSVERELEFARAASNAGIPTPRVYGEVLEWNGRFGIVYERIKGSSLMRVIWTQLFRMRTYSRTLADLHFKAHTPRISGLQTGKEILRYVIQRQVRSITQDEKSRLVELTDSMPDGDRLCHNDFHPDNVILRTREEGGPVIIDWEGAGIGDPAADVARTRFATEFTWQALPNKPAQWIARWWLRRFYRFYSHRYFELSGVNDARVDRWMTLMAARQIDDGQNYQESLIQYVRERLAAGL